MSKHCPLCNHPFQGNGWEGIDSHWRSNHERDLPYIKVRSSILSGLYKFVKRERSRLGNIQVVLYNIEDYIISITIIQTDSYISIANVIHNNIIIHSDIYKHHIEASFKCDVKVMRLIRDAKTLSAKIAVSGS